MTWYILPHSGTLFWSDTAMVGFQEGGGPPVESLPPVYVLETIIDADATPPTKFVAGGAGWQYNLDINAAIGKNAQHGKIDCEGSGNLIVAISSNSASGGDAFTVEAGTQSLDYMNIDTIQINAAGDQATSFRLLLY